MDFINEIGSKKSSRYNIAIVIMSLFIIGMMMHLCWKYLSIKKTIEQPVTTVKTVILPLPPQQLSRSVSIGNIINTYTIQEGDALTNIFQQYHLSYTLLSEILKSQEAFQYFRHLQPGQTITFTENAKHQLQTLIYNIDSKKYLQVNVNNDHPVISINEKPMTKIIRFKSGIIHRNLAEAAEKAGLTTSMVQQLSAMFSGQINLSKNLHPGDRFNVLYHEYFMNGQKDHPGHILAAEIIDHQKHYRVVRFTNLHNESNYYLPNGESIKSAFLKVPLRYNHISSGFAYHRFDPYLHEFRKHLGIDYAASFGTPVKAIGNGRIVYSGWMNGYGKAVIIRYNRVYKTLYGHLEKFAKNLKHGELVKKGQIVGYVGRTGWATGPHLHFELYKNNTPINPLKIKLYKSGAAIPVVYRQQFFTETHRLFSQMTAFEHAQTIQKK